MRTSLTFLVLCVSACGSHATEQPASEAPAVARSSSTEPARLTGCAARVALFEAHVAQVSEGAWALGVPDGIAVVASTSGEARAPAGPTGSIASDGALRVDGREEPSLAAFHDDVESYWRNWSILHPGQSAPRELALFVDRGARVGVVRAVVSAVAPHPVVLLVLDRAQATDLPACPSSLGESCGAFTRDSDHGRAEAVAMGFRGVSGTCGAVPRLFGSLAAMDTTTRDHAFRAGAPRAVAECECGEGIDVDAFEYLTLVAIGALEPWLRVVPMPAATDADDATLVSDWLARSGA